MSSTAAAFEVASQRAPSGSESGSAAGSISTVQLQWGRRSAGIRGGRWTGRIRARGLVAEAVASNVGSSMWWHIVTTNSGPRGSTSINAPHEASENSP
jgi:hypothetical protein